MTLLKPTLYVSRLLVLQGGHKAFDEKFHKGVNILRGRNSSGKTTIMDLLAFSLGSENIRWKPEALQCTATIVEVELNGTKVCLKREISQETQRPIAFYWGDLASALVAAPHLWELYPFRRSENKINFSQAIFTALEIPHALGDGGTNLTLHQLMRVLYADQPSIHSPIFRSDHFDSALTRETVGNYLSGIFNDELYSCQLRLREVNSSLDKKISELKGIFNVLGRSGHTETSESIDSYIKEVEGRRVQLASELERIKIDRTMPREEEKKAKNIEGEIRKSLNLVQNKEASIRDEIIELEVEIADSYLFTSELNSRLQALGTSNLPREMLGNIKFDFCPSCLSKITISNSHESCHLCHSELDNQYAELQILRMKNELNIQLKESSRLLSERETKLAELRKELPLVVNHRNSLKKQYENLITTWSSELEIALESISRSLGGLDQELVQAHESKKLYAVISELQLQRSKLQNELDVLKDRILQLEAEHESRKLHVSVTIEKNLIRLLKQDLPLQPEFVSPVNAAFSFIDNTVTVNGSENFSESSAVVLRHLFHLALLSSSIQEPYMRLPRFLMLDGVDDGGMEKNRSHNLQEIIIRECSTYNRDYQLIFATSEISDNLEGTEYVVGRAFNQESRSLDVKSVQIF
jgi:hypothetical protein